MTRIATALFLVIVAVGGACGKDASTSKAATRVVKITMTDNAFSPSSVDVTKGATVRFVFTNKGGALHEALVGDAAIQMDHESSMNGGAKAGMHDHSNAVTVKPGKTASITHTFSNVGALLIGCHEPGHYTSGMKMTLNVTA